MAFFRALNGRNGRQRTFRPVLLILVLGAVCWGFWQNNQRRLDAIVAQGLLRDDAGALSSEHKEAVTARIKTFKREFGVPLEIAVLRQPPPLDRHDPARMYLDIVPDRRQAYLFLPPLVRHAVGEGFVRDFEAALRRELATDDWHLGLIAAILTLKAKLAEVTR